MTTLKDFRVSKLTGSFTATPKNPPLQVGVQYTGDNKDLVVKFIRTHGKNIKECSVSVNENGLLEITEKRTYSYGTLEVREVTLVYELPVNWCVISCPLHGVRVLSPENLVENFTPHTWGKG